MKKAINKVFPQILLWSFPLLAAAQSSGIIGALGNFQRILNTISPIFISAGLLYFLWGVVQYLVNHDDKGKMAMFWGIIALFVMVSVWGLVNLLSDTFLSGSSATAPRGIPTVTPIY